MKEAIFKAYDIRGIYPEELNEEGAERIGRAFVEFTKAKKALVGEDARVSTPALKKALIKGLTESGADVVLMGQATTPMFYFAIAENDVDAGMMITASHNPGQYNGFKMVRGDAMPIGQGSGMEKIKNFAMQNFENQESGIKNQGEVSKIDIKEKYIEKLLSLVNINDIKELRVAVDAGNGMAGVILPQLLEKLPQITVEKLYMDIDMSFPNHEANPLKEETLKDLKKKVQEIGAHIGIAYDGDGDRVGFVDERGEFVRADLAFSAILPELLSKYPGGTILYDLRCSKILPEEIERLGGKSQMTRVGHAFIKKQLQKAGGIAATELSSHFYFKDFYGVECSDLIALYLLIEISKQNKPLSQIIAPFKKYHQSGEINFEVENKSGKIKELKEKYKSQAVDFTNIDGIRLEFKGDDCSGGPSTPPHQVRGRSGHHQSLCDWWWFNVRPSNTEPLLRLNAEASDKKLLEKKVEELSKIIKS